MHMERLKPRRQLAANVAVDEGEVKELVPIYIGDKDAVQRGEEHDRDQDQGNVQERCR